MTLREIESAIGDISLLALQTGGEERLDQVTSALGVATRHLQRIHVGTLWLNAIVEAEIRSSLELARERATAP